jgi:CHAT domain-containing protein/tetratricopeptide (TPR) repeat protein
MIESGMARSRSGKSRFASGLVLAILGLVMVVGAALAAPSSRDRRIRDVRRGLDSALERQRAGDFDSAQAVARRALDGAAALRPPSPELESEAHVRLAHILCDLGDFKTARLEGEAAVECVAMSGPSVDSLAVAAAEHVLGKVLLRTGDREAARTRLVRALGIRERRQGTDHPDLVPVLQQLATWHALRGDFPAGNAVLDRALGIVERMESQDPVVVGSLCSQAANFHSRSGDYVEAARLARLSLAAREKAYGPEHKLTVQSILSLSAAQGHLGDHANSVANGERAVAILRRTVPHDSEDLAFGLSNLGSAHLASGEWTRALTSFREAAAIREKLYGPESPSVIYLLTCMADAQLELGDLEAASATYGRVAAVQARQDPQNYVSTLTSMAQIERRRGRLAESLALLEEEMALCDTLVGTGSDHARNGRRLRIDVLSEAGRRREALEAALALEREEREVLRLTAARVSEREATAALAVRVQALDGALGMAVDSKGLAHDDLLRVWDELIRSRAMVFDVLSERRRRLHDAGEPFARLTDRVDEARAALAAHLVRPRRASEAARWRVEADSLREVMERAERALGERSASFLDASRQSGAGYAEVAGALPRGTCLVSFVRYRSGSAAGTAADRYLAMIASSGGGRIDAVSLGAAEDLDPMIEEWRAMAGRPPGNDAVGRARAEEEVTRLGRALRRATWDRLASRVGKASIVYLVPDGALRLVNFAALPDPKGRYLAESGPLLATLTTERDLLASVPAAGGRGLLIVGGPDFDHGAPRSGEAPALTAASEFRSAVTEADRVRFGVLAGAAAEGSEIADLWRTTAAGGHADLLSGAAATESALERSAGGRKVLHFATHGFVLGGKDGEAGSRNRPGGVVPASTRGVAGVTSATPRRPLPGAPPLSVCGLAMAGANTPAADRPDDGFLTGAEISALPLAGTEWAVLSACRTGVADVDQPESVQGLHRAFRLAGVATVIMSLWPVEDEPTREWMVALYRARLAGKATTPESVRAAQRVILAQRRLRGDSPHPFYWAPFVAVGSPR